LLQGACLLSDLLFPKHRYVSEQKPRINKRLHRLARYQKTTSGGLVDKQLRMAVLLTFFVIQIVLTVIRFSPQIFARFQQTFFFGAGSLESELMKQGPAFAM